MTVAIGACSTGNRTANVGGPQTDRHSARFVAPKRDREGDSDDAAGTLYDRDDMRILSFGQVAKTSDAVAIGALVKRYYAANADADGAQACQLLYPVLAEAVPEDYGRIDGLRGDTCAAVMSKMMRRRKRNAQLAYATLTIGPIRVEGTHGYALIGLRGARPDYDIRVRREGAVWRINSLTGSTLP